MSNPFGTPESGAAPFRMLAGLADKFRGKNKGTSSDGMSRSNHFHDAIQAYREKVDIDTTAQMKLREHETTEGTKQLTAASQAGIAAGATIRYKTSTMEMQQGQPRAPKPATKKPAATTKPASAKPPVTKATPTKPAAKTAVKAAAKPAAKPMAKPAAKSTAKTMPAKKRTTK